MRRASSFALYSVAVENPACSAWVRTWRPEPAWTHLPTVRRDDQPLYAIQPLDISAESVFKTALSGGNYVPPEVGASTVASRLR